MAIKITYLDVYSKILCGLTKELQDQQELEKVSVDREQAERLSRELEKLKDVIENLPKI